MRRAGKLLLPCGLIPQQNVTQLHSKKVNHLKRGKARLCERCFLFVWGFLFCFLNTPVSIWCSLVVRMLSGVGWQIELLWKIFAKIPDFIVLYCVECWVLFLFIVKESCTRVGLRKELWGAQEPGNREPSHVLELGSYCLMFWNGNDFFFDASKFWRRETKPNQTQKIKQKHKTIGCTARTSSWSSLHKVLILK